MLYRNILLLAGGFAFVLASGCSNDTAGSTEAPLVPACTEDFEALPGVEWLCSKPEVFPVECEDGVGDPEKIYFEPIDELSDTPCGDITLTLDDEYDEPFPVGSTYDVIVEASNDDESIKVECPAQLIVEDTQPPEAIHETIDDAIELWPPNHKFHTISGEDCVRDACDGDVKVKFTRASSDEPVNDKGDGNTEPDIIILDCDRVQLRSERQGGSNGRVYTLEYTAVDDAGYEITDGVCVVTVPHDQSGREVIDDGEENGHYVDQENDCDDGTGGTGGAGGEGGMGGQGGQGGQGGDDGEGGTGGDVVVP